MFDHLKIYKYLIFRFVVFIACFTSMSTTLAQYYLRGEVLDDKKKPLPYVKIFSHKQKLFYYTGPSGSFGINLSGRYDSLTLTLDGYETAIFSVDAQSWQTLTLKEESSHKSQVLRKKISFYDDYAGKEDQEFNLSNETYLKLIENPVVQAAEYPKSSITLNINKASYSNVRRFLNNEMNIPPDAVRLEEMINYYNLQYEEPEKENMFRLRTTLTQCPWDDQKQLLYLTLSARKIDMSKVPPGNFVFLIDASGSMDLPNRLPLIKAAFRLFVNHLRPIDTVSIVTYGGDAMVWLSPTSGSNKSKIMDAIESLEAQGDTPGESAIKLAYRIAGANFIKGGINRVIIATDGDFNVGETSEKALEQLITREKASGIYLTCMGVGSGNLKDSKLQVLAKKGNGNYVYLDDIREAEKVFMNELTQTICTVADNTSASVEFNSDLVSSYRLIGFDNEREDIDAKESMLEGGQIGSGTSIHILYEILKKNTQTANSRLGNISINFQIPSDTTRRKMNFTILDQTIKPENLHTDFRFLNTITMFGLRIRKSRYFTNKDWKFIASYYQTAGLPKNYFTEEFGRMIDKAAKLFPDKRKRKRFIFF